jgi:hypothetical protein
VPMDWIELKPARIGRVHARWVDGWMDARRARLGGVKLAEAKGIAPRKLGHDPRGVRVISVRADGR